MMSKFNLLFSRQRPILSEDMQRDKHLQHWIRLVEIQCIHRGHLTD
ncbi:hypothetical protein M514_15409 [Trichuris suis]|uniref:Uncharacterized protein n=1 Tax=Trichuris suis TaxID=68888 RepID=A0A085NSX7_9BILA|nr:hypothetical protein M514_15409 [Trichuris suis]